jgi:hypothetical protein
MLSSFVEVSERKRILTEDEREQQIKVNIEKSSGKKKYSEIQFSK